MPRSLDADDYKQITAIYVLMSAMRDQQGISERHLQEMMPRYLREAERRHVELPPFYRDAVYGWYPEVRNAFGAGFHYGIMEPRLSNDRIMVTTNLSRWVDLSGDFTADAIQVLREAARLTIEKHAWHKLDDDLEEKTGTATQS